MPLVLVCRKQGCLNDDMVENLSRELPGIVAEALHVEENPNGHLSTQDVEVMTQESGGRFDTNVKDLEIIIWANVYPERLANLDERRQKILDGVRKFLSDYDRNLSGFVWVLLQPGSFGEL